VKLVGRRSKGGRYGEEKRGGEEAVGVAAGRREKEVIRSYGEGEM